MIIGLEWICIALLFVAIASILLARFTDEAFTRLSISMAVLSALSLVSSVWLFCGVKNAQVDVQEHYVDYLKLQTKVAQYEELEPLQQYQVATDVMTYNLWYERNKADLENEWSLKGSSGYAKEFNYIVLN